MLRGSKIKLVLDLQSIEGLRGRSEKSARF